MDDGPKRITLKDLSPENSGLHSRREQPNAVFFVTSLCNLCG